MMGTHQVNIWWPGRLRHCCGIIPVTGEEIFLKNEIIIKTKQINKNKTKQKMLNAFWITTWLTIFGSKINQEAE